MSLNTSEDNVLIGLFCKTKNKDAFAVLYQRHLPMVLMTSLKYMKDQSKAEDITQQIFEKLLKRICEYEIGSFKSWLYQMTKNQCLMQLRKKDPLKYSKELSNEIEQDNQGIDAKIEQEQRINNLELAIDGLNEKQRICLELFYMQGMSYAQIEEKTGWTFNEIRSFLQNAKRNLKNTLES